MLGIYTTNNPLSLKTIQLQFKKKKKEQEHIDK